MDINSVTFKKYGNYRIGFVNKFISTSVIIEEISKNLTKTNVDVILDNLLYYGNTSQRYSKIKFVDGELVEFQFINISRNNPIRILSSKYYHQNKNLLEFSVVDQYTKKLISRELIV